MTIEFLPTPASLLAFITASTVLAVIPGPSLIFVLTRVLAHGRRTGVASLIGVALGNWLNAAASALGLTLVFQAWPGAFDVVRYLGAAYLFYLGWRAWRQSRAVVSEAPVSASSGSVMREAGLVALLNPKTTLFFASFLPQFVDAPAHALGQSLLLGTVFVAVAALVDLGFVWFASQLMPLMTRKVSNQTGRVLSAVSYVTLGLACIVRR